MLRMFIFLAIGLSTFSFPGWAAEPTSQPCFKLLKRKWPEVQSGNYPVCREFGKNLNSFCGDPVKIVEGEHGDPTGKYRWPVFYEVKINPKFPKLQTPKWEPIDPKANQEILADILGMRYGKRDLGELGYNLPIALERLKKGQLKMERARFDLDNDGKLETAIRLTTPDADSDKAGISPSLAVVDEKTGTYDTRFEFALGRDAISYEGRTFLVQLGLGDETVVEEPFSVRGGEDKGGISVCVFNYLK